VVLSAERSNRGRRLADDGNAIVASPYARILGEQVVVVVIVREVGNDAREACRLPDGADLHALFEQRFGSRRADAGATPVECGFGRVVGRRGRHALNVRPSVRDRLDLGGEAVVRIAVFADRTWFLVVVEPRRRFGAGLHVSNGPRLEAEPSATADVRA